MIAAQDQNKKHPLLNQLGKLVVCFFRRIGVFS